MPCCTSGAIRASLLYVIGVLGGGGCGEAATPTPLDEALVSRALPALHEVPLPRLPSDAINGPSAALAVAASGHIALLAARNPEDPSRIWIVDSTGEVVARVGRPGNGPGEVRLPGFLAFREDGSLLIWDTATRRVTHFSLDGTLLTTVQPDQAIHLPLGLFRDSVDFRDLATEDFVVYRAIPGSGRGRRLFAGRNPMVDSIFPNQVMGGIQSRGTIAYAASAGRAVLGDMDDYRILLYDAGSRYLGMISRPLPPELPTGTQMERESEALLRQPISPARRAEMLQRRRQTPLPYFGQLRFDDQGRLWVIRRDGDAASADVFADTELVGTLRIPCHGFEGHGWDLRGEWLAMSCFNPDPEAISDGIVRLFRIEG